MIWSNANSFALNRPYVKKAKSTRGGAPRGFDSLTEAASRAAPVVPNENSRARLAALARSRTCGDARRYSPVAVAGSLLPMAIVPKQDPELAAVVERARRRAEASGELRTRRSGVFVSPLTPEACAIVLEWLHDGGYDEAVAGGSSQTILSSLRSNARCRVGRHR